MGLNKDLGDVRLEVMATKPLPSLRELYFEVRHEESRKKVMMVGQPTFIFVKNKKGELEEKISCVFH